MNPTSVLDITAAQTASAHSPAGSPTALAVLKGLSATQKHLPPWLFYDAEGSRLFEEITRLPEYYLTGREHSIFSEHAAEMIEAAAGEPAEHPVSVVELGAGSASKTLVLLRALVASQGSAIYLPVDVSEEALKWAGKNVHAALPMIDVQPIRAEITHQGLLNLPDEGRRLALYIGSSIGNYDPEEAVEVLGWLRSQLQPADALLLGTDMLKDAAPLLAAYNDKARVTAAFNQNMLTRLNRELGANFALNAFEHRAVWNPRERRMEMHLESKRNQRVHIRALDRSFQFKRGESIHTESSYKFRAEDVDDMLTKSGFALERSWYDANRWFGVHLARAVGSETMIDDDAEEAAA